jgi:hypothetical protein
VFPSPLPGDRWERTSFGPPGAESGSVAGRFGLDPGSIRGRFGHPGDHRSPCDQNENLF